MGRAKQEASVFWTCRSSARSARARFERLKIALKGERSRLASIESMEDGDPSKQHAPACREESKDASFSAMDHPSDLIFQSHDRTYKKGQAKKTEIMSEGKTRSKSKRSTRMDVNDALPYLHGDLSCCASHENDRHAVRVPLRTRPPAPVVEKNPPKRRRISIVLPRGQPGMNIVDILLEMGIRRIPFSSLDMLGAEKIGEASFSDVYEKDGLIYKVVPLGSKIDSTTSLEEFCKEAYIFGRLSSDRNVCKFRKAMVVTGPYPSDLLSAWDDYKRTNSSENRRPSVNCEKSEHGIIVMENCGIALESFQFADADAVREFFRQLIGCLARLEKKHHFEHRDLHLGNVLIDNRAGGLRVRIIDFSLSRIGVENLVYVDLSEKDWLFSGDERVDEQFGVYKEMRKACSNDWSAYTPKSNVMWVAYLAKKIEAMSSAVADVADFLPLIRSLATNAESSVELLKATNYLLK